MDMLARNLYCILAGSIILNCANQPPVNSQNIITPRQESAIYSRNENSTQTPEYRLGYGDVIEIKFFNNERFNETIAVRPDGRISMQKVGEIYVSGMTPPELDSLITQQYAKFIIEPDITILVRQFGGYQVYVLGEVNSPGGFPIQRDMTLLQAIAAASGFTKDANLESVIFMREGQNNQVQAFRIDLGKPLTGSRDIYIQPSDVIYIPSTYIASLHNFLNHVYGSFLPPADLVLRILLLERAIY